jgi:hypothetical protein
MVIRPSRDPCWYMIMSGLALLFACMKEAYLGLSSPWVLYESRLAQNPQSAVHSAQIPSAWVVEFSTAFQKLPFMAQPGTLASFFTLDTVIKAVIAPILSYWLLWMTYARTIHPLAKIPGPLWPAVSRTWLMYRMYLGDLETHQRALHRR